MGSLRELFFKHQAQTTPYPLGIEVAKAKGSYIFDRKGKSYLDFVAGVSACSLGHLHPKVVRAVRKQLRRYMHVMVYGEFVQEPSVLLTQLIAKNLPPQLSTTYLTNSGTEAIEGALKLAKRSTGRFEIIAAQSAYHGSTHGAMSVMGFEERKRAYRPLLPGVSFIKFNDESDLNKITSLTAAVILETIQGGAGFICPQKDYLKKVRARCNQVGCLLILDEIQPAIGRTGTLFAFEHYGIIPDIVVMGKGLGGGLPVGAFTASSSLMHLLQHTPKLGHITTFGGNPIIASACYATLQTILSKNFMVKVIEKENLFRSLLTHHLIEEVRGKGLMLALIFKHKEYANQLVTRALDHGLLLFFLLFEQKAVRITPPLNISNRDIRKGCQIINFILDSLVD